MGDAIQRQGSREPRPGTKAYELQPDKKSVGEKLKRRIAACGMSQAEFARRVGTDPGTVSKWVHGEALADVRWWNGISAVLDASIDDLLAPPVVQSARLTATPEERATVEDAMTPGYSEHDFELALKMLRKYRAVAAKTTAPEPTIARRRARSSAPPR